MRFREWVLREMGHVAFDAQPLEIGGRSVLVIDFRFEDYPPEYSDFSPQRPFSARLGPSEFLNYITSGGTGYKITKTPTPLYTELPDDWWHRAHVLYTDGEEKHPRK